MFRTYAIAATLLVVCGPLAADVYRWTDAQGRVQYSDRWMPGAELIKTDKNKPSTDTATSRQSAVQTQTNTANAQVAEKLADQRAAQAVQQDVAKARDEQCKKAKERYDSAIRARRIFKESKDGSKEYVSDAEADQYRLRTRTEMDQACGTKAN
jgi:hypothetical protein